jgi:hypothetical protein
MGLMHQQRSLLKSNIIKLSPKINFILGDNAVEPRGVKSNYFGEDLVVLNRFIFYLTLNMELILPTNPNYN